MKINIKSILETILYNCEWPMQLMLWLFPASVVLYYFKLSDLAFAHHVGQFLYASFILFTLGALYAAYTKRYDVHIHHPFVGLFGSHIFSMMLAASALIPITDTTGIDLIMTIGTGLGLVMIYISSCFEWITERKADYRIDENE